MRSEYIANREIKKPIADQVSYFQHNVKTQIKGK